MTIKIYHDYIYQEEEHKEKNKVFLSTSSLSPCVVTQQLLSMLFPEAFSWTNILPHD